jgi:two-component system OmpR family sensor kinase
VDYHPGRIRTLFMVAIPLLLLLAGTGGWFLARRSFRPVSAMAARAREISATTLHERLPVVADDELGALARVMNDLLDRLERSFEQQRRFVADASHELRSPTAILRSETDITLSREHRSEGEYRESMAVIQATARRLTRVVDDLFLLARVDGGHPVMSPLSLYLDEVVQETVRVARPLAEQKGVNIEVRHGAEGPLQGDPDLLGRALLNLLDNAIRHSPDGGSVEVSLEESGSGFSIRVVDAGAGIPPEARERLFERFFQVDSSRTRAGSTLTSGAGLGLAIGRHIAEMHGGSLVLAESCPGRTEFLLTLPKVGIPGPVLRKSPSQAG